MFEAFNKCQYPNLAAEIHAHRHDYSTFATHGNITTELLHAFLKGEQQITREEARSMARVSNSLQAVRFSPDYLLAPKFAYYDMRKKKHYEKVMSVLRRCDEVRQLVDIERLYAEGKILRYERKRLQKVSEEIPTAERAAECRYIGRIVINMALRHIASLEELATHRAAPKPRGIERQLATASV